ncbi:MAG: tRNA (adenosine(37)-N6)-threonylcarbamoyltransferase complex dimerization subunit type 1 TsaB [Defluviitaleaceae bacterium]|nr:tRNA (adenosine(37)-N6)-threonylcarbamoyltransferase complex dimerization subunit type 1 TsaB [Defluviitaleaceae bacterium]
MKILALDTSGKQAGAAIMDEYITIGEICINAQSGPKAFHHSQILMPGVERLFALCGMELADIDYVAYVSGPGSFTGLRIGAATALGLARGANKLAVGVPTLDALAYNMLCVNEGMLIVPLMDARRGQVYGAIYRKEGGEIKRLTDYFACSIEDALAQVPTTAVFLGDGTCANKTVIEVNCPTPQFAPLNANRQRPASVALCALHQLKTTPPPNPGTEPVEIIYIRDPQAVREQKKS